VLYVVKTFGRFLFDCRSIITFSRNCKLNQEKSKGPSAKLQLYMKTFAIRSARLIFGRLKKSMHKEVLSRTSWYFRFWSARSKIIARKWLCGNIVKTYASLYVFVKKKFFFYRGHKSSDMRLAFSSLSFSSLSLVYTMPRLITSFVFLGAEKANCGFRTNRSGLLRD